MFEIEYYLEGGLVVWVFLVILVELSVIVIGVNL